MDMSAPRVNSPIPTISSSDDRHGEDGGGGLLHFFVDGILNRQMVRSFSRNFRQHAARLIAFRSPEGAGRMHAMPVFIIAEIRPRRQ